MNAERERSYWDRHAVNYDRSMWLFGRAFPRLIALVGEGVAGSGRVLEVAAGTGLVTVELARRAGEVVATDYAEGMVAALERRVMAAGLRNVRCEQADLYALRFEPDSFDAVVAANVLHLVPDLPAALAALHRVLRPSGRLIVPTFCHAETAVASITSRILGLTGFPGHRRLTARALQDAVEASGFRVTRTETLVGVLPLAYVEATPAAQHA